MSSNVPDEDTLITMMSWDQRGKRISTKLKFETYISKEYKFDKMFLLRNSVLRCNSGIPDSSLKRPKITSYWR